MRSTIIGLVALWAGLLWAQDVPEPESNRRDDRYYSEAEARERVYGAGLTWQDTVLAVDADRRAELHEATGLAEIDSLIRLTYATDRDGNFHGGYRIASEIGKYRPFEFLVGLGPDLKVKDVVVLNYRESHGGEVRRQRFLRQYRGKSVKSPVRLNRDVLGIAGATLSAWAVNRGVKKTLWWCHLAWAERAIAP